MLLQDIDKKEDKKKNKDMEMEITWGIGIKDKAEELIKKKLNEGLCYNTRPILNVGLNISKYLTNRFILHCSR